jgi:hypothetical protein
MYIVRIIMYIIFSMVKRFLWAGDCLLFIDFIDTPLKGIFSDKNTYTYQLISIGNHAMARTIRD